MKTTHNIVFITSLVVVTALGTFAMTPTTPSEPMEDTGEALTWENHITVKHNDDVVWEGTNALTDQGKNWIRSQIANVSDAKTVGVQTDNASYIMIGNGSAHTSGGLQNPILDTSVDSNSNPVEGNTYTDFTGQFLVNYTFTAAKDIGVVNTTALNYGSGQSTEVSVANFSTEANLLADDQLTVTQNITIS